MEELITVCIPVYNGEKTIEQAIRSLLQQTYKNVCIIVCDNASTDNTRDIIEKLQKSESRIFYKKFETQLDVNYSFLRALNESLNYDGDIVCLYHADDWYYTDILETEYQFIRDKNVGAVFGLMNPCSLEDITLENIQANYDTKVFDYSSYINRALVKGTIFNCPTFMTKKSVLKKCGLLKKRENMISDMSFWLSIVRLYDVVVINRNLMNYRKSKDQLSSKIFNRVRLTISPSYILLDQEIDKIKKNKMFRLNKLSIIVYRIRRAKEILKIRHNLKISGLDYSHINKILREKNLLSVENLANNEEEYLNILYGRK